MEVLILDVLQFLEKFDSLSEGDKRQFLCHVFGSCDFEEIKKYKVIEKAFNFVERKDNFEKEK